MTFEFNNRPAGNQPVFVCLQGSGVYKNAKTLTEDEIIALIKKHGFESNSKEIDDTKYSRNLRQMNREPRKEKKFIVENLFEPGELIIFAGRQKSGKSFTLLDLLLGIASGGRVGNRFIVKKAQKVLLIDWEMPKDKNLDRIDDLKTLYQNNEKLEDNFNMVCLRETGEKVDLSTKDGQDWVENELQATKAKILAIDNLGGVISDGAERRETVWRKVHTWARALNSKGITVIFVHHKNKSGEVSGTNKILNDIDLSISLQRPEGWSPADGNIIEFHFADVRFLTEDQVIPFSIKYHTQNGVFKRDIQNIDPESGESTEVVVSEEDIQKYNLDSELKIEIFTAAISGKTFKRKTFENGKKGYSGSNIKKYLKELCDDNVLERDGHEYQLHQDLKKFYD